MHFQYLSEMLRNLWEMMLCTVEAHQTLVIAERGCVLPHALADILQRPRISSQNCSCRLHRSRFKLSRGPCGHGAMQPRDGAISRNAISSPN